MKNFDELRKQATSESPNWTPKQLAKPIVDATGKRGKLGKRSDKNHAEHLIHILDKSVERSERLAKLARQKATGFKRHREELISIKQRGAMVRKSMTVLPDGTTISVY